MEFAELLLPTSVDGGSATWIRWQRRWSGRQQCGPDDEGGGAEKNTLVGGGGAFAIHRVAVTVGWTRSQWRGPSDGGDGRADGESAAWTR
jgi:hypothetical protein